MLLSFKKSKFKIEALVNKAADARNLKVHNKEGKVLATSFLQTSAEF